MEIPAEDPATTFLKTVLPTSNETPEPCGIPGLGLDAADDMPDSLECNDYRPLLGRIPTTPLVGRMISMPTTPIGSLNHMQMGHSTPLQNRSLNGESHTPSPYSSENSQINVPIPNNTFDTSPVMATPLQPPPMPPIEFLDDNCYNKLPPKFPTWTFANDPPPLKGPPKWEEKGLH